jgi:hypothetical protein
MKKKIPTAQSPGLIDRLELAARWKCHRETLRRMEKKGLLHRLKLGERMIRYDLLEICKIEKEAR